MDTQDIKSREDFFQWLSGYMGTGDKLVCVDETFTLYGAGFTAMPIARWDDETKTFEWLED